jgi:DNA (cytosine-5)-methyltransferase 1
VSATTFDAVDDFAGPGGWDEGARMVGLKTVGIEHDHAACMTAVAAGHARIRADVSVYPSLAFAAIRGYIASPPCTLFSSAGTGVGKLVFDVLDQGIRRIFAGEDCRAEVREAIYPVTLAEAHSKNIKRGRGKQWPREKVEAKANQDAFVASLVLEPARRIVEMNPEWVALEQVPEVLPLWKTYVRELRARGYSAWTGVLNSANYGVPQTRERAVVMASRVQKVAPPAPTHSQYGDDGDLFGESREKWVSMAHALGWGFDEPSCTVSAGGAETGGAEPFANAGYRRRLSTFVQRERSGDRAEEGFDAAEGPSQCLTSKARSWQRTFVSAGVTGEGRPKDPETQPADTLTGKGTAYWIHERPATTIVGSFKPEIVSPPGYRTSTSRQNAEGGVRVTVAEGGVLQSFPADYPWRGSRSKQYQQVGNAIPPLLAAHILSALMGRTLEVAA